MGYNVKYPPDLVVGLCPSISVEFRTIKVLLLGYPYFLSRKADLPSASSTSLTATSRASCFGPSPKQASRPRSFNQTAQVSTFVPTCNLFSMNVELTTNCQTSTNNIRTPCQRNMWTPWAKARARYCCNPDSPRSSGEQNPGQARRNHPICPNGSSGCRLSICTTTCYFRRGGDSALRSVPRHSGSTLM